MKEDIQIPKVEGVSVAVVAEMNEDATAEIYNVYLVNLRDTAIDNVLVSSTGYGLNFMTGEDVKTSTLRHFIGRMAAKSFVKIEPIFEELFGISNQYWLSFYVGKQVYDKKFIFLPETITAENMIRVPLLNMRGVMIQ